MNMKDKILVIGSMHYDIITKLPRMPERGEDLPALSVDIRSGGKGANQAVQAAKLGKDVVLYGKVGDDAQGKYLLETIRSYGVDTQYIEIADDITGLGLVNALPDGSIFATIAHGANYKISEKDIRDHEHLFEDAEYLLLQMEISKEAIEKSIELAEKHRVKVIFNTAPALPIEEEYLKKCSLLIMNEVEAQSFCGFPVSDVEKAQKAATELNERYGAGIIITLGARGSVLCDEGKLEFVHSEKVNAIQTTGAGDSYVGAVASELLDGKTLTQACRFATKCSALTVMKVGAQDAMPFRSDIEKFFYKN